MISVDWTLILQFFNFIVLLVVLNRLLYAPLRRIIQERRQTIAGDHQQAQDLQADIDAKMERYQQQLNDAKVAATEEKGQLKKAATEEEARMLAEARGKATAQLNEIRTRIDEEAEQARQALHQEADTLARQIAVKVLDRDLA